MALAQKIYLTQTGKTKFQEELSRLKEYLWELIATISSQRRHLLSEDGDLEIAQSEYEFVSDRINQVSSILSNSTTLAPTRQTKKVKLGSQVHLKRGDDNFTYTMVSSLEANPQEGKISDQSPLGSALLDKQAGDTVHVPVPSNVFEINHYEVVKVQ